MLGTIRIGTCIYNVVLVGEIKIEIITGISDLGEIRSAGGEKIGIQILWKSKFYRKSKIKTENI